MPAITAHFPGLIDRRSQHRRQHPRAAISWPVTVIAGTRSLQGQAKDISRGGALIYLTDNLDLGDEVRLAIEIPDIRNVITATGKVVRAFSLKRGDEKQFTHGIGLKFTDITEENLKFFSGNLAPEWKKDYSELELFGQFTRQKTGKDLRYPVIAATIVIILSVSYAVMRSGGGVAISPDVTRQIEDRLGKIEGQLESYQQIPLALKNVEQNISRISGELLTLKNVIPEQETIALLTQQMNKQNDEIGRIYQKIIDANDAAAISPVTGRQSENRKYHVVKKGETLYRISLETGLTLEQLRQLNGLEPDSKIMIGQKLIIQ